MSAAPGTQPCGFVALAEVCRTRVSEREFRFGIPERIALPPVKGENHRSCRHQRH